MIFYKTFEHGLGPPIDAMTSPDALHAIWLTLLMVAVAVPLNTVFGVGCALLLVRHRWKGNAVIDGIINLPFAISPIVIGLSLFLLYGNDGWFGPTLSEWGIKVLFSTPGMILASVFVSLPFVVRETVPVLQEIGTEQEQAASTLGANAWQTFWRVTLPAIRWGVAYGVVLTTARVLGEFGAVTIVSGSISGPDRNPAALRRQVVRAVQRAGGLRRRDRARPARPDHPAADERRRPQSQGRRGPTPVGPVKSRSQCPTRRRVPDGNRSRGSAQALR